MQRNGNADGSETKRMGMVDFQYTDFILALYCSPLQIAIHSGIVAVSGNLRADRNGYFFLPTYENYFGSNENGKYIGINQ